jgi:hypothetical protein
MCLYFDYHCYIRVNLISAKKSMQRVYHDQIIKTMSNGQYLEKVSSTKVMALLEDLILCLNR